MRLTKNSAAEIERMPKAGTTSRPCMSRRSFLLSGGTAVVCALVLPKLGWTEPLLVDAIKKDYPRKKIGRLSALKEGVPMNFNYPDAGTMNFLVKLGEEGGGGIGPATDVVAFNGLCTHMGGPLFGLYNHEYKAAGPCPFHLTTFDLRRFGIVAAGHATESLPQILLEAQGDDIYAVGVMGLLYGKMVNL